MNRKSHRDILDSAAADALSREPNLWPAISVRLERRTLMTTLRARLLAALMIVLFILLILAGAAYALGRALGYIPGVGFVEQGAPIRVLEGKPSVQHEGITLTMNQLIADAARTTAMYRVKGVIFARGAAEQECIEAPSLLLENEVRLESIGGYWRGRGYANGFLNFDAIYTFPPLPTDAREVTLLAPCELPALTLSLVPAPEGFVLPAAEIPATFEASHPFLSTSTPLSNVQPPAPQAYPTDFPATPTPVSSGSGLYLEKVVELEKSYLLVGNFTDAGELPGTAWAAQSVIPYEFRITDHNEKPVSFFYRPDLMPPSGWANVTYWALEILKPLDVPLIITLPEISVYNDETFRFPLDVGAHPTVGQTWQLNQTIQVGGHSFLVEKVTLEDRGYTLTLRSLIPISREDFFLNLTVEETDAPILSERIRERNGILEVNETLVYDEPPTGTLNFTLNLFVEDSIGPWTLAWSPPNGLK